MTRTDHLDAGFAAQGVEQFVGLHPGDAEHGVHAVLPQPGHDRFTGGPKGRGGEVMVGAGDSGRGHGRFLSAYRTVGA
ncbi:hypothetical protein [Kocuria sp. KRD140]|uniref:hypothetical protein n=1 Tax=Kocuria sp. KRD140 TaxID=2729723 RepID=UPI0019D01DF7|nr:hypothetical protein [Kocuria sp. KRD140]